jgi:hypothetical protein
MVSPYWAARHTPPPLACGRAWPVQVKVNWLESMMATTRDSENMPGCNTVEFIAKERGTEVPAPPGSAAGSTARAQHIQICANQPVKC